MSENYVREIVCLNIECSSIESVVGLGAVGVNENYVHVVV